MRPAIPRPCVVVGLPAPRRGSCWRCRMPRRRTAPTSSRGRRPAYGGYCTRPSCVAPRRPRTRPWWLPPRRPRTRPWWLPPRRPRTRSWCVAPSRPRTPPCWLLALGFRGTQPWCVCPCLPRTLRQPVSVLEIPRKFHELCGVLCAHVSSQRHSGTPGSHHRFVHVVVSSPVFFCGVHGVQLASRSRVHTPDMERTGLLVVADLDRLGSSVRVHQCFCNTVGTPLPSQKPLDCVQTLPVPAFSRTILIGSFRKLAI